MSGHGEGDPSFDPKTWRKPGKSPPAEMGEPAAEPTMDPRAWARPAVGSPVDPKAQNAPKLSHPAIIGILAGLVIITGGGIAAFGLRGSGEPPEPSDASPTDATRRGNEIRRTFVVVSQADLQGGLVRAGLPAREAEAATVLAAPQAGGSRLRVAVAMHRNGSEATLASLEVRRDDGSGARVVQTPAGMVMTPLAPRTTTRFEVRRGEMNSESFYSSAVAQGLTDSLISPFAQVFAFDFDFQREIAAGDDFEAVIEQAVDGAGRPIGAGRLVYASLKTSAKSLVLYRFRHNGEDGWYEGNGRSSIRAFMRTPVEGARISSGFGMRRHPILGYDKLHPGTDFAAPTGTPIYAASAGTVEVAAERGAAGNFVRIAHENGWRTQYLHLNAFAPGIAPGVSVSQGQQIGEVGTTGRSTGPHLHYEIITDAGKVDPLSIETGSGRALTGSALASFIRERDRIDQALTSQLD
jgi:murein DD-endopeptidase MepM/ murein hydrolase activator NlpD